MTNPSNDLDLYTLVLVHLDKSVSKEASECFKYDPSVFHIKDKSTIEQRMIINRYFTNLLFTYRARVNDPVNNEVFMLTSEGTAEDWFKLFTLHVTPFLKTKNVFGVVYNSKVK